MDGRKQIIIETTNVIGFYTYLSENINLSFPAKIEWFAGEINEGKVNEIDYDDIVFKTLQHNETTLEEYSNETGIGRIMFKNPVPVEILLEHTTYVIPIFEDQKYTLNLKEWNANIE